MQKNIIAFGLSALSLLIAGSICPAQEAKPSPCQPPKPCRPMTADEINSFFGQTTYPFRLSLKLRNKVWDTRKPLVVDAVFTNTSGRSVFIDLKSRFQFNGYLDDDPDKLGYTVVWRQVGKESQARREDYTEIPAGGEVVFTLTSLKVEDAPLIFNGVRRWKRHKRGYYDFFVNFNCGSRRRLFQGEWAGQAVSDTVKLYVR
jgi:hypothetical protein